MSVESTDRKIEYVGPITALTVEAIPFRFLNESVNRDLKARSYPTDDIDNYTEWTYGVEYAATGGDPTGSATINIDIPTGTSVLFYREENDKQQIEYSPNDDFPEASHEKGLDKGMMIAQELRDELKLTVRQSVQSPGTDILILPQSENGKYVGWVNNVLSNLSGPAPIEGKITRQVFDVVAPQSVFNITEFNVSDNNAIEVFAKQPGSDRQLLKPGVDFNITAANELTLTTPISAGGDVIAWQVTELTTSGNNFVGVGSDATNNPTNTVFNLGFSIDSAESIDLFINKAYMVPTTDYTKTGAQEITTTFSVPDTVEVYAKENVGKQGAVGPKGDNGAGVAATTQDVTSLKAIDTTNTADFPDKSLGIVEDEGIYIFDRGSVDGESLPEIVAPTVGVGRWKLQTLPLGEHNSAKNIQGGLAGQYNHLTNAELTKLGGIEDSANNYSHPNHTGDVTSTGDGATVIDPTAITGKTTVPVATGDFILISDTSDSGNLKKVDAADLLSGGGLSNVVEDTTPQLGGDLDAQTNDIINLDNLQFDTSPTTPLTAEGSVFWDANEHALAYKNDEADVTMQLGQELYIRVRNESGVTINNGQVVYVSGVEAGGEGRPLIGLAQANSGTTSKVVGVATHSIENNTYGYVSSFGVVNDLDTSTFTGGDVIYLSDTVAGAFTASAPTTPNFVVTVGYVVKSDVATGSILVSVTPATATPAGDATEVTITALKGSVGTINIGQVVTDSGWNNGSGLMEVELADADSPSLMSAIGIARDTITNSSSGAVVFAGKITGINTSGWSVGDPLYVSTTPGTLTNVRPTGAAEQVQKVGTVLRSNASNGVIQVSGAGRSNDQPNIHTTDIFRIADSVDNTKIANYDVSSITTATTRTITMPDSNVNLGDIATNNAKVSNATHTGDVTGSTALTIANDVVTNAKLANMAQDTIKGRVSTGTGDPEDLTASQVYTLLKSQIPAEIGVACSDEVTDLTTGTAKVTFRMPYAMTLTEVRANVNTAPVGSTINVDINEGGVSVLSTVITIDASEKTSETAVTPPVISDSSLADDAEITIDIDQVGSTTAGKGLKVWLIGTRT